MAETTRSPEPTDETAPKNNRLRRTIGAAAAALAVPALLVAFSGSANAAELAPIAEVIDDTVAGTSEATVAALSALLGVS